MKIINLILSLFLLVSCSNIKGEYSKISSSFSNMIVFKKQIDTRETRIPIGNQKYVKDLPKKNLTTKEVSIITNEETKPQSKSYLGNLFKSTKNEANHNNKYPELDSIPTINKPDPKSLKQAENDIKDMRNEIEQTRREVDIIEHNIEELKDEKQSDQIIDKPESNLQIIKEIDEEGFYNNSKYMRKKSIMLPNSRYN